MMPESDIDQIAHLDFAKVGCQCEQSGCAAAGGCDRVATEQVAFHALDHCESGSDELDPFGNYVLLLCMPCLLTLSAKVAEHIDRLNVFGIKTCRGCGAPARELSDLIREVTTL